MVRVPAGPIRPLRVDSFVCDAHRAGGKTPPGKHSAEELAGHFRFTYFNSDPKGFVEAVRTALYQGVNVDLAVLRKNDTIAALGTLMMSSRRGAAAAVVTFNFDDLLETYLDYHGFVAVSVMNTRAWATNADVAVLHPHGFIPFDARKPAFERLVFDKASYLDEVNNPLSVWRQKLLTIMRAQTCILVGLGGSDWNLSSLLAEAKREHASLEEETAFWGVSFATSSEPIKHSAWEQQGVYPMKIADYDVALPNFLFEIAQKAARLRRSSP